MIPENIAELAEAGATAFKVWRMRDIGRDYPHPPGTSVSDHAVLYRIFEEVAKTDRPLYVHPHDQALYALFVQRAQAEWGILTISHDPLVILLIINLLLLFLGCIMEGLAIMILLVPVLLPVTQAVGIDPVHFGVVVVMNLMIGILTPPFGVALFVVAKVGNIPFHVLARAILPFLGPLLVVQVIVTYWPGLILFLPRLFFD